MIPRSPEARAEDVARAAYGKLIAMLASRSGDIASAEDALSDAFVAALRTWPERGIPDKPEAWLLTVAKNRRTDQARKEARLVITDEVPDMPDTKHPHPDLAETEETLDERLKLLFVCAHPAIDAAIRTPLMLQTVLGLEAEQIAQAFLVSPSAMAQRLVRAKKKIKSAGIPFVIPEPDAFPERMGAVLEAVYGAYAVDWLEGAGDLSHEAFFLSTILTQLAPDNPEAMGLTALIGFIESRRIARVRRGVLVPVPEQDTDLWDKSLIDQSAKLLTDAAQHGKTGRFQLEAAIQAVHAARTVTLKTDWRALSQLYAGLLHIYPTIGAAVSRAAAVAEDAGPGEGLAMLAKIDAEALDTYQPAYAVRADCLAKLGRTAEAAEAYAKAISLCTDLPSRRWLEKKSTGLRKKMS
ncbi:RNA polymerase sigma factor [Pseudaestuariivita sp.]|uniref:RNA polymerase sigma factor n=1 Tax=Pseudaestuariivita sp. TaxID=2211669 RepID=UPI0040580BCA